MCMDSCICKHTANEYIGKNVKSKNIYFKSVFASKFVAALSDQPFPFENSAVSYNWGNHKKVLSIEKRYNPKNVPAHIFQFSHCYWRLQICDLLSFLNLSNNMEVSVFSEAFFIIHAWEMVSFSNVYRVYCTNFILSCTLYFTNYLLSYHFICCQKGI